MDIKNELEQTEKEILKLNILGIPGATFIGLSLYALFEAKGNAFHPLLNNQNFVYILLAAGIMIEIWQLTKLLPLFKKRAKLAKQESGL